MARATWSNRMALAPRGLAHATAPPGPWSPSSGPLARSRGPAGKRPPEPTQTQALAQFGRPAEGAVARTAVFLGELVLHLGDDAAEAGRAYWLSHPTGLQRSPAQ